VTRNIRELVWVVDKNGQRKQLPLTYRCLCGRDSCYGQVNHANGLVSWYCTECWLASINAAGMPLVVGPGAEGDGHEVLTDREDVSS
jgi:hypothetical protein